LRLSIEERLSRMSEKRRTSPPGAGAVIRRPPKVSEITNRIAAPSNLGSYHQMCARTQIAIKATPKSSSVRIQKMAISLVSSAT
jgi:hypothetical protein